MAVEAVPTRHGAQSHKRKSNYFDTERVIPSHWKEDEVLDEGLETDLPPEAGDTEPAPADGTAAAVQQQCAPADMQVDAPPAPRPLRMKKKSKNAPPADATPQAAGAPVQAPPAAETRTPAYKHVDGVRLDLRLRMKTRPPSTQEDIGAVRRFPGPPSPGGQLPAGLTAQRGSIGPKFTRTIALVVTDVEFDLAPPGLIPANARR